MANSLDQIGLYLVVSLFHKKFTSVTGSFTPLSNFLRFGFSAHSLTILADSKRR